MLHGSVFVVEHGTIRYGVGFELFETVRYNRPLFGDNYVIFWDNIVIDFTDTISTVVLKYQLRIWVEPGNVNISPDGRIDALKLVSENTIHIWKCPLDCDNYFCAGNHMYSNRIKL